MCPPFIYRLYVVICVIGLSLFYNATQTIAEEQCSGEVCFSWAFGAIVGLDDSPRFVKISRDTELKSGDQLKMLVKLNKKCFVYILYYSSQGELYMLFPYNLNQFSNDYEVSKKYYIPQGSFVFELDDNVGKEKIYLIASVRRLHKLENLFGSYNSTEDFKKPEYIENIIHEIRQLRKRHKKFTTEAERPVASIGPIRAHIFREKAELPDLSKFAVQINAESFFAKTFTIDHK